LRGPEKRGAVGEDAVRGRRGPVSDRIVLFGGVVLLLALFLVVFDGIGTGVGASDAGASGVTTSTQPTLAQTTTTQTSAPTTTTTTLPPTTTTTTTPPPAPTTTVPPPAPAPPAVPSTALPARGQATADGCAAAVAYLSAYSAPGFTFECPGNALGHQAMTCINEAGVCDNENLIAIADPCPAAYMNEASNSWVLTGASDAPIDPYGACSS
jgi:hypothetical protein